MIPDRDIWRSVNLLIREHGAEAEIFAAQRADEMLDRGGLLQFPLVIAVMCSL
jgi:8-oxo-dGTP pyrophosphatase MutT (NUDIX family)